MRFRPAIWLLVLIVWLAVPWIPGIPLFWVSLLNTIGIAAIVALGLVVLTGIGGMTSFGQASFMGFGAYASALLTTTAGLSPWLGLPAAILASLLAALVIGAVTLRLSGHYLALATIAWSVSLFYLFGNLDFTGRYDGISGIPPLRLFSLTFEDTRLYFAVIWICVALVLLGTRNLLDSRSGRAIRALRGGAGAAASFGAHIPRTRMLAFLYAAMLAGVAGWLYTHLQRAVNPTPFGLSASIEYLLMAVVGGAGHIGGALLGAAVVTIVNDRLQSWLPLLLHAQGNFEVIVFGALLVLVLQSAPEGLWPHLVRVRPTRRAAVDARPLPRGEQPEHGRPVLETSSLRKTFGGLVAVNDVSFTLNAGEIVGLIGPNGAGKSTTFNLLTGVARPTAGEVRFLGESIAGLRAPDIARLRIARSFQHVKLVAGMSVIENVALGAHLRGRAGPLTRDLASRPRGRVPAVRRGRTAIGARGLSRGGGPAGGQPRPRPAADRRDRACAVPRSGAAAARRARRRIAPCREGNACGAAAPIACRRNDDPARGARHGLRHGPHRPAGRHGFWHQARRRTAGRGARRSRGDRSLSGRRRVTAVLEVSDVMVGYGGIPAVQGVSLRVDAGSIVTVIGPNGAGKTTLLNAVMGVLPAQGAVAFTGNRIGDLGIEARVRRGMCLVPEKRELFATMSVEDNLRLGAFRFRREGRASAARALDEIYALFPRLRERRRQAAGTLSGGERQMLAMGRALMTRPTLLMLDEPSLGLAPLIVRDILRTVAGLREKGVAILLVEQNARAALEVADYGYVLEMGRVTLEGPSRELAADPRVIETYLGSGGG